MPIVVLKKRRRSNLAVLQDEDMKVLLRLLRSMDAKLIIVSDANSFFIEHILEVCLAQSLLHGLSSYLL